LRGATERPRQALGDDAGMHALRHIRLRRRESAVHKLRRAAESMPVKILAALLVVRGLWRHRPPLLSR
jgi:hypothetical protein